MHQGWLLIGLSLAYLGLLFLIAYVADKNKRRRPKGQPLLYSLSLAVYCTSWTFFGTVGQASESPWSPVPIYLGPMLVSCLAGACWPASSWWPSASTSPPSPISLPPVMASPSAWPW